MPILADGRLVDSATKRSNGRGHDQGAKRRRLSSPAGPDDDFGSDDGSSSASSFGDVHSGDITTPRTPVTPRSPRRKFPSEEKTHLCPQPGCSKSFNRPARLAEHLRSHNNERPFVCPQSACDKTFLRESHLKHHTKSAHGSVRDYSCQQEGCEKRFLTATRLRRHQAVHEGRDKFRCQGYGACEESFRKHATLQRHIEAVHLHRKPFPCTHLDSETGVACGQAFDTAAKLRGHEGRAHGGVRFWCTECASPDTPQQPGDASETASISTNPGTGFATYALLQSHLRTIHPPTCSTCSQPCASQRDLRRHIEILHAGPGSVTVPQHACPDADCDRTFSKLYNLNVHVRTVHLNEKRFVCTPDLAGEDMACGRAFKTKGSLMGHVGRIHLGDTDRKEKKKRRPVARSERTDVLSSLTTGQDRQALPQSMQGVEYDEALDDRQMTREEEAFEDAFDALVASELQHASQQDTGVELEPPMEESLQNVIDPALVSA